MHIASNVAKIRHLYNNNRRTMYIWNEYADIYAENRQKGLVNAYEAYYMNNKSFGYRMKFVKWKKVRNTLQIDWGNTPEPRGSFKVIDIDGVIEGQEIPGKKPRFKWYEQYVTCVSYELKWTDHKGKTHIILDVNRHFPMLKKHFGIWTVNGCKAELQLRKFDLGELGTKFNFLELIGIDDDQRQKIATNTHVNRGKKRKDITQSLRQQVLERDGHQCQICGRKKDKVKFDIDHIYPRIMGGDNRIDNLQVLCTTCNRRKGADSLWDYVKSNYIPVTPRIQAHIDRVRQIDFGRNKS